MQHLRPGFNGLISYTKFTKNIFKTQFKRKKTTYIQTCLIAEESKHK